MKNLSEILSPAVLDTIFAFRAPIVKTLKPKKNYFLFPLSIKPKKDVKPLSYKFGFDRGTPIDRYYIEKFLKENKKYIKGRCLEIHDTKYVKKYGSKITKAEALDVDTKNDLADIYGDLRNLNNVKSNTYDCLVVTQTFGMIDDYESAVKECSRILKPGGTILATATSMGPMNNPKHSYWRFTVASMTYVFSKFFKPSKITVKSFGNALAGQASWVGVSREELTDAELDYNDPRFPLVIGLRATK